MSKRLAETSWPWTGRPAVFLDKDGTLIDDVPYNVTPERMRLRAGAAEASRLLHAAGYALVVVSNQSGVARGLFPERALGAVTARLHELLGEAGARLTDALYCPHHPDAVVPRHRVRCPCRKPAPGLLMLAARRHGLDLGASWMVGDILDDVEAGWRAGCRTLLLDPGGKTEWRAGEHRLPHYRAPALDGAARLILAHHHRRPGGAAAGRTMSADFAATRSAR